MQISLNFMLYYLCMTQDMQNLNTSYYPTLDENFKQALNLFEKELTTDELFTLLKTGNIVQKQIAALKLDYLENTEQAKILVHNLTGQDGKIREAVALKIYELISKGNDKYFFDNAIYDKFLQAIIDVNGNVCRNIIASVKLLQNNETFCQYFTRKLLNLTQKLIDEVQKFNFQDGKYKVNKEVFKLYWCLETIFEFTDHIPIDVLKNILKQTKDIDEYTIREKTAKILAKIRNDKELSEIRNQLKHDKNYYVRRF